MTTLRNLKVKHFLIDINITKADKEGAVVILDIKDYIDKANRQLNDTVLDTTVFKEDNKRMSNQPKCKVIYRGNQNIVIPLKIVLPIARH